MAIPTGVAGAGLSAAGQGLSEGMGMLNNLMMYGIQKEDALDFWHMQNAYNHPAAQRQRLEAAGINPNLIYGSSPAGAGGNADQIKRPELKTQQFGNALSALSEYSNFMTHEIERDNLKKQGDLIHAQWLKTLADTARTDYDLEYDKEMRPYRETQEHDSALSASHNSEIRRMEKELMSDTFQEQVDFKRALLDRINEEIKGMTARRGIAESELRLRQQHHMSYSDGLIERLLVTDPEKALQVILYQLTNKTIKNPVSIK